MVGTAATFPVLDAFHYGSDADCDRMAQTPRCLLFWLMVWAAVAGSVTLIYVAVWMQFTLDGQRGVIGINSRYFLPLVPLLAMQCAAALQSICQDVMDKPVTSVPWPLAPRICPGFQESRGSWAH